MLFRRLEISIRSLSLDSMARSWDFVISIITLSMSWSAERFIYSVFFKASTLIFCICVNFSRTSLARLLAFSSILFSFSLYSRSDGPPIVYTAELILFINI
jgi:hypothetical protein